MNTTKKYLKGIRYRQARCCKNCKHFIPFENYSTDYCWVHDNPIFETNVCKYFAIKKPEIK